MVRRQIYFDKTIKNPEWVKNISGENEESVVRIFDVLDYHIGIDYIRQHGVGERYIIDFAFVNEKVAIEADGTSHFSKRQKKKDEIRDRYLFENQWICIRISTGKISPYKMSFYKNLIQEVVEERRKLFSEGKIYPIDFTKFNEKDFE